MSYAKQSTQQGITLIALIITIIVMLILVSVTVNVSIDGGLFSYASKAKEETRYASIMEEINLWKTLKGIDEYTNDNTAGTSQDLINRLYNNGAISETERDKLLAGEVIIVADKEIVIEEEGRLYVSLQANHPESKQYAVIDIIPKIAGTPELQTYEEYVKPQEQLATKTEDEKLEIIVEYEKTQNSWYYNNYYPGQEVTLDLVFTRYGVTNAEELCEYFGYDSIDALILGRRMIDYAKYNEYNTDYRNNYMKYFTITNPDGTTATTTNISTSNPAYIVTENGSYTFTVECEGQTVTRKIEITGIVKNKEIELAKEDENTYQIYSIEDLMKFATNVNNGHAYEGKTVKLMKTLDFNEDTSYENPLDTTTFGDYNGDGTVEGIKAEAIKEGETGFIPVGTAIWVEEAYQNVYYQFKGTFEGNNNEIKNLYINKNEEDDVSYGVGLFSNNYGTIQNLKLYGNININTTFFDYYGGGPYVGALVGKNYGTISNCHNNVKFTINTEDSIALGGIAGESVNANIINCTNLSDIEISGVWQAQTGGIVASNYNSSITNCENLADINVTGDYTLCGGMTGYSNLSNITKCKNSGNINIIGNNESGNTYVGGILGRNQDYNSKVKECINNGEIKIASKDSVYAGGIAGALDYSGRIVSCVNTANITLDDINTINFGGIVGYSRAGLIANSYNRGNLTANINSSSTSDNRIGGIIGWLRDGQTRGLLNSGAITVSGNSKAVVGGIAGYSQYGTSIDVYNIGAIIIADGLTITPGGIFGTGYQSATNIGGFAEGTAEVGCPSGHTMSSLVVMDLNIDVLLEKMNAATLIEDTLSRCEETSLAQWEIDTNISTTHPVLELE